MCLGVGSRLEPEGDQPADEDDPSLKEALLGAVQRFTTVLLPAHYAVVRFGTHGRHICTDGRETQHNLTPETAVFDSAGRQNANQPSIGL